LSEERGYESGKYKKRNDISHGVLRGDIIKDAVRWQCG
jgi:hypothetical protein